MTIQPLVSTEWLAAHLNDANLRVADVRWYLLDKDKHGRDEYLRAHIPGAVFLDVDTDLASPRGQGPGRHPLPRPDAFDETMARAGIGADTHVIAYDDCGGATAARLWWLLRYFGHEQVSLLDGGVVRWIAEGRPLQTQVPQARRAAFVAHPRPERVVDRKVVDALRKDAKALVLDVRVPERYEGKVEPIDPRAGHIPGAVFLDVDTDLASPRGQGPGRHPLPRPDAFAETMARAGIGADTYVIAYDDCGGATAARLWWLLRYFGHAKVSLLDGGIVRWIAEGRPLQTQVPQVPRAAFVAHPHPARVVDRTVVDALRKDAKALVLDVRVPERYEGKVEPIDPRAGHVPGAKSAPLAGNLIAADDPRFLDPAALRARYSALGVDKAERVVAYCGSGINACQAIFAMQLAGIEALLYEGAWSDWSSDPEAPVAIGVE